LAKRLAILVVLALIAPAIFSQTGPGRSSPDLFPGSGVVTRVSDGDSLRIRFADSGERRLRLIGFNSPELDDQRESAAFWAFLAKRFADFHLRGRGVRLEYDETPVDDYGRILAYIVTEDGALFNELIIREGFAYAFLKYPFREDYRARFSRAQADAKREGRGLWHSGEPETIAASAAGSNLGRFIRVRFECATVTRERGFVFLRAAGGDFEALVPLDRRSAFPRLEDLAGRTVVVTGFLEAFRGRPQIMLNFGRQLELEYKPN
jgi:micrococcal nuclease